MAIGVVADLVSARRYFTRDLGKPVNVGAALKKSCGHPVPGEDFQNFRRTLTRTVVERQRHSPPVSRTTPHRTPEDRSRSTADGPCHEAGRRAGSGKWGYNVHEVSIVSPYALRLGQREFQVDL